MCGKGVLLAEAPHGVHVVGVDKCVFQLQGASENLCKVGHVAGELLRGDASRLALMSASVDVAVCDMPFGKQSGSIEENQERYPAILAELWRVVKPGGRCVLLTSTPNGPAVTEGAARSGWTVARRQEVKLPFKMQCVVYVLLRGLGWQP